MAAAAAAAALLFYHRRRRSSKHEARLARLRRQPADSGSNSGVYFNQPDAPEWLRGLFSDRSLRRVLLREWEDLAWRRSAGWHGVDLIHAPGSAGVRVHCYFWHPGRKELTGIVEFGPAAESHRGLCHGGAMTSLMDDLCGHICFVDGSAPWCGATVQVNCKLSKPVKVGHVLKLVGKIEKTERKKVSISATLTDQAGTVYATLDGLSITPVDMHMIKDEVAERTWLDSCPDALCDTGWLLPL